MLLLSISELLPGLSAHSATLCSLPPRRHDFHHHRHKPQFHRSFGAPQSKAKTGALEFSGNTTLSVCISKKHLPFQKAYTYLHGCFVCAQSVQNIPGKMAICNSNRCSKSLGNKPILSLAHMVVTCVKKMHTMYFFFLQKKSRLVPLNRTRSFWMPHPQQRLTNGFS